MTCFWLHKWKYVSACTCIELMTVNSVEQIELDGPDGDHVSTAFNLYKW